MARGAPFRRKPYKQTSFGAGIQPGTVEWEINGRKELAADRAADVH